MRSRVAALWVEDALTARQCGKERQQMCCYSANGRHTVVSISTTFTFDMIEPLLRDGFDHDKMSFELLPLFVATPCMC